MDLKGHFIFISAEADGGPRFRVGAHKTLRLAYFKDCIEKIRTDDCTNILKILVTAPECVNVIKCPYITFSLIGTAHCLSEILRIGDFRPKLANV